MLYFDSTSRTPGVELEPRSSSSGFILFDFNLRKLNLDLHSKCVMEKTKEQTCKERKITNILIVIY